MGKNQRLSGKPIQGEIEKSLRLDIIKDGNLQLKEGIKSFSFEYLGLKNNWNLGRKDFRREKEGNRRRIREKNPESLISLDWMISILS
jgi:hypothetical protein